ncbi:MAG: arsenate reductase ArsC [Campylobacterales bacterium]|nr:arsenate reductase ArsC [Campylobacterales bacterium]
MKKVLFVCTHNSARSQIAEELLKKYSNNTFYVSSCGYEPENINPLVVKLLKSQENIDISKKQPKSVFELFRSGKTFNYVISLWEEEGEEKCPVFPGVNYRLYWNFKNPKNFNGNEEIKIKKLNEIKEDIKAHIFKFIEVTNQENEKVNMPRSWRGGI